MAQSNLDALILPSSLFSDAVNTLIDRYQEAKCQLVAFKKLIPCHVQEPTASTSWASRGQDLLEGSQEENLMPLGLGL